MPISSTQLLKLDLCRIVPSLSLENLPNRDCLPYADLYGIPDAETIYRGTLRYSPLSSLAAHPPCKPSVCASPQPACCRYAGTCSIMHSFKQVGLLEQHERELPTSWPELCHELSVDSKATDEARDCLKWLGVFEEGNPVAQRGTVMDAFCALLEEKLAYGTPLH